MRLALCAFFILVYTSILWAQPLFRIGFQQDEVGTFPSDWKTRDESGSRKVYSVGAEGDKKFLHADANGLSVQISLEKKWDMGDYPVLRWQWRAVTFPERSNERVKSGNDSVLGLYVVLSGLPFVKALKYIWSDTQPLGAAFDSPFSSGTKMIVIRSGKALAGTWVTEERNVLSDYRLFFKNNDAHPKAIGIGILTDSDNTHSQAVGDYGPIEALPNNSK